jgi:mannitol/fructose-specific phosphotransferase system IIA component (Ntr-type)
LPRTNFQGHVRTLAGVAHLLNNHAFREEIMAAETVDEVMSLIVTREGQEP